MPVNVALIGLGHMGRIHLGKLCSFEGVEVCGIVDVDSTAAGEYAQKYSVPSFSRYSDVLPDATCAVIATPTESHYAIARACLERGVHVFLEKPITVLPGEARELVDMAAAGGLVLQVGHLERLNPALRQALPFIRRPRFIEARRISPFTGRSTDVDVVLDLMIHDIDLVLSLVGEEVKDVSAQGVPFFTDRSDVASARIEFTGGCVANITASRVSTFRERSLTIYEEDRYFSVDLMQGKLASIVRNDEGQTDTTEYTAAQMDPVRDELLEFVRSVEGHSTPSVSGADGLRALELASRIQGRIAAGYGTHHR
jgi:predicted dehydrogenase